MTSTTKKIFSLTRFKKEQAPLPCWLGGRFFKINSYHYFLKSQGLLFFCESSTKLPKYQDGTWVKTLLISSIPSMKQKWKSIKTKNKTTHNLIQDYLKQDFVSNPVPQNYFTKDTQDLEKTHNMYQEQAFSYQKKGVVLQNWFRFLKAVENFFISKGLALAQTPYLVECPGTEPHLQALKSSFKNYYLPTSPELHLKKLLCQDWTDFFEIKTCFREEESNDTHQVEFHLLEWYRAFYSLEELMKELHELILFLHKCLDKKKQTPSPPAQFFTMAELFEKHLQFSLQPQTSKKELFELSKKKELPVKKHFSFEDLFFLLFLNKIEPYIPKETLVFISHYPAQLRAFAQINSEGWADRFECYWKGWELANAFYEVTHFEEQKQLFLKHIKARKEKVPIDKELLKGMASGMPPCSGVALGLDRLFLALSNKSSLKTTRLFPL